MVLPYTNVIKLYVSSWTVSVSGEEHIAQKKAIYDFVTGLRDAAD